ncbi:MAG: hypothetical protein JWM57_2496, partial [Phycisphaerales bacterium]|nr:hypothetical protein [Phycisphaerales bacterium]
AGNNNNNLIDPTTTGRLNTVAPGLISESALRQWPANLDRPKNWLRTDLSGLIPYTGAGGDEADVRVWAFAAFLRNADSIQWDACLPAEKDPQTPADPNELVWFYPGSWFGVDQPVPTVQIKWLRRAQQDFEYLQLAKQRGTQLNVLPIARLLAKPVEIQPGQAPDPTYGLLIGTANRKAWSDLKPILTQILQSRGPGITPDENAISDLNQRTLRWMEPLEKPVILPRRTEWNVGTPPPGETGTWVNLRLGFDLYNASDTTPDQNLLSYDPTHLSPGWIIQPQPVQIPKLSMYQVAPQGLSARLDPARVNVAVHAPVRINFKSGFNGATTPLDVVVPMTRSVRRRAPLVINGSLDDWVSDDGLQGGPLVKLMSRPAVQSHTLEYSNTRSELFSSWGDDDWYLAFRVEGLSPGKSVLAARNFVEYQNGRAWGEDVCEVIMQAVYEDGTTGPLVYVAVKPGGNVWVERKMKPNGEWQTFAAGVRYAATLQQSIWRGEVAVPWPALINPDKTDSFAAQGKPNLPTLLKFNFIQHKRDSGESASWAGPIDGGRDDGFTGVVVLKEPE